MIVLPTSNETHHLKLRGHTLPPTIDRIQQRHIYECLVIPTSRLAMKLRGHRVTTDGGHWSKQAKGVGSTRAILCIAVALLRSVPCAVATAILNTHAFSLPLLMAPAAGGAAVCPHCPRLPDPVL